MAESIITLGIGSAPGSITPFLLTGLVASDIAAVVPTVITGTGSTGNLAGTGSTGSISGTGST